MVPPSVACPLFAELAQRLQQPRLYGMDNRLRQRQNMADEIMRLAEGCQNLCGRTDLGDAVACWPARNCRQQMIPA